MSILHTMGLHIGDIDHAWENMCGCIEEAGLEFLLDIIEDRLDEVWEDIDKEDPTKSIIETMFKIGKEEILQSTEMGDSSIAYQVNGYDSDFTIDPVAEKCIKLATKKGLNYKLVDWMMDDCFLTAKEIESLTNESVIKNLEKAFKNNEVMALYTPEEFNEAQGLIDIEDIIFRTCDGNILCRDGTDG